MIKENEFENENKESSEGKERNENKELDESKESSENKETKESKLKHVRVYDQLYEMIQNGTFPPDSRLPSETVLSAQLDVSRMTLRKALTLLQDDGMTRNVQGVGHFVCRQPQTGQEQHPVNMPQHPVYSYCTEELDAVEMAFRIEPPTKSISDVLKQYTPAVVIVDRWYKQKGVPLAYSLSFLPIGQVGEEKIDLNQPSQLQEYLESQCYDGKNCFRRICSHSTAGNFTALTYTLSDDNSFLLVQENISDVDGRILVSSKHYIPSGLFRIEICI
ncbi:MAG: GntR family transcriptional regulator [Lachnospiraceae bacterium]|nr:GntR family transcriptional regulator [Lachnospiraceae bacterium]